MRRYSFFLFFLSVFAIKTNAQLRLDYANRYVDSHPYKVITPTKKNLIAIVDCTSDQFMGWMKQYGYWASKEESSDYTHILYENNSLDFYLDGGTGLGANFIELSETYKHAQIYGKISNVFPQNALAKLRIELSPYYRDRTDEGIERFVIEDAKGGGYLIQIVIKNRAYYQIHVQHFAKLHN